MLRYGEAEALLHAMSPGPPYRGGALDVFANITSGFYQPPKMFILARFGRWRAIRNLAVEAETEAIAAAASSTAASSMKTAAAADAAAAAAADADADADAAGASDSVDSGDFDGVRGAASTSAMEKEGGASDTKKEEAEEEEEEEEEEEDSSPAAMAALNTAEGWTATVSDTAWGRAVWAGPIVYSHHNK